jgi:FixJ family two-component response regulator
MTSGFTVFLVDDDEAVLRGITRLLQAIGYEVRSYSSPAAFLEDQHLETPGCAVLDLAMPGLDGLALQEALAERGIERPIVFLTGKGDIPTSVRAMKAGAVDFLTKPVDHEAILAAIERAAAQDAETRLRIADLSAIEARLARLTPREREVLSHVVAGRLNKQIAHDLGTVEKTIKVHRGRMMEKLEVRSVAELMRFAARAGL